MTDMIVLKNLTRRFGSLTAVDDISLAVRKGDVLGFLGPNGAGKSTTMKMVAGFLTPTSGQVEVNGFDVQTSPIQAKKSMGYLPEGAPLYQNMTPQSFLTFTAQSRGFQGGDIAKKVDAVVEQVALQTVLHQPIDTLSKGYKRRVGLAQAILHDPDVLILDEPTDGLDPNQKLQVRNLIREMAENKAIIVSTHILEEVEAVCNRAAIIAGGQLKEDSTAQELVARLKDHNSVVLRLADENQTAKAKELLEKQDKVAGCEIQDGLIVYAKEGAEIAPDVAKTMADAQIALAGLSVKQGRLVDIFRQLTMENTKQDSTKDKAEEVQNA